MIHNLRIVAILILKGRASLRPTNVPTLTWRFDEPGISTERCGRICGEMLFTAPRAARLIGGVILGAEAIRQQDATGAPLALRERVVEYRNLGACFAKRGQSFVSLTPKSAVPADALR